MELEEWKNVAIPGLEKYLVSSHGRVFGLVSNNFLDLIKSSHGYLKVNAINNITGISSKRNIHELVATTYNSKSNESNHIIHEDENVQNNHKCNLKWVNLNEEFTTLRGKVRWRSLTTIGYPNYIISDDSRIKNIKNGNFMKTKTVDLDGYCSVYLTSPDKIGTKIKVHIIVAKIFLGLPPSEKHTVDHIDRDRTNNHFSNLRWFTLEEQSINKNNPKHRNGKPVFQYDKDGNFIKRWENSTQAAVSLNMSVGRIYKSCKKHSNTGNFTWRYEEDIIVDNEEEWKNLPIDDHGLIEISNKGRVRGSKGIYTCTKNTSGYIIVSFVNKEGIHKKYRVHILVAATFLNASFLLKRDYKTDKDKYIVNHKNGIKDDNRVENLEIITPRENVQHAHNTGLIKQCCKRVVKTNKITGERIEYISLTKAGYENNKPYQTISQWCHHKKERDNWVWNFLD